VSTAEQPANKQIALCLSGGGYRAMLFHAGALWRLNELGYLPKLDLVSSVSGGSITAGVLAKHWDELAFRDGVATNYETTVVDDLLRLAGKTIDIWAVLRGLALPGPIGDRVARSYRRLLFGKRTLQSLPDHPRFVINATNLQSGRLWRFTKPYMADYRVGQVLRPEVELAVAVAASSAFPPFLAPVKLKLKPGVVVGFADDPVPELMQPPYTTKVTLADGGVYDNLGLQAASKAHVVLVSDGGAKLKDKKRPHRFWPFLLLRVLKVEDNQVRSLRKSHLVDDYEESDARLDGTYWGLGTPIADYTLADALPAAPTRVKDLATTPTRLGRMSEERRQRLVNWGYASADAAMRRHVLPATPPLPEPRFPFPERGV
jgi:NTE family protein